MFGDMSRSIWHLMIDVDQQLLTLKVNMEFYNPQRLFALENYFLPHYRPSCIMNIFFI